MKILAITLGYIWTSDDEEKSKQVAKRRAALDAAGIEVTETDSALASMPKFIVTESQLAALLLAGEEAKVEREVKLTDSTQDMLDAMRQVATKLEAMKGGGDQFNARCDVHMPGNALMSFNVTMLLESSCTDELQAQLDKGWRIIAACPQPDQRRPDYILGRFDPTHSPNGSGAYRY
jgi:hypothetical protein